MTTSQWAAMTLALLAAAFSGPAVQTETGPQESADVDSQQPEQPSVAAPVPAGNEIVLGSITGIVNVNGEPVAVNGSVNVRGGLRGPNSAVGVALTHPAKGGRWDLEVLPAWAQGWIIPDSMLDEQVILGELGDWVSFNVDFNRGGHLRYEISVASADPPFFCIEISGELSGELATPDLPLRRVLNLYWNADETITGDGTTSGRLATGESYSVPAVISGKYHAANPGVVPAKSSGKLAITSYNTETGHWEGFGARVVARDLNGDGLIDEE